MAAVLVRHSGKCLPSLAGQIKSVSRCIARDTPGLSARAGLHLAVEQPEIRQAYIMPACPANAQFRARGPEHSACCWNDRAQRTINPVPVIPSGRFQQSCGVLIRHETHGLTFVSPTRGQCPPVLIFKILHARIPHPGIRKMPQASSPDRLNFTRHTRGYISFNFLKL